MAGAALELGDITREVCVQEERAVGEGSILGKGPTQPAALGGEHPACSRDGDWNSFPPPTHPCLSAPQGARKDPAQERREHVP